MDVALGTIAGFGVGGILVPASTVALTACPDHLIGSTVALSLSIRVIGGSIGRFKHWTVSRIRDLADASTGYAIYYNIFTTKLKTALPNYIVAAAVDAGLPKSEAVTFVTKFTTAPASVASLKGVTPAVLAAATSASQTAYAYSLSYVWYTSIAFGFVSIVACACLGNTRRFLTDRVAARIRV